MISKTLRYGALSGSALLLSACGLLNDTGPRAAGLPFDARLSTGESVRAFTVTVAAPGATLDQVRESARYPATRHCIDTTGVSTIEWSMDPATGDWATARTEDGNLVVSGQCAGR